jgi:RNA polymerase sigma factor for flagellar operon FliA
VAEASEELARFESAIDLVDVLAKKVLREIGASLDLDELRSYGRQGLLEASRRFDPSRGVPFRGYASFRVRGAILDGVRSSSRLPRRAHERLRALDAAQLVSEGAAEDVFAPSAPGSTPADAERALAEHLAAMATAMAVGLLNRTAFGDEGERVPVATDASPEQALAEAELLAVVTRAIDELPENEAALVRRHYLEGERFDHVAKELGLSKSWASRLHTRAIRRLSEALRDRGG